MITIIKVSDSLGGAKGDALRARQSSKKKRKHADQPSGSGFSIVDTGSDWGAVKAEDDDTPMGASPLFFL